jgi:hypothetical protein
METTINNYGTVILTEQPKRNTWKRSFRLGKMYITFSNCRLKKKPDFREYPGRTKAKDIKTQLMEEQQGTCPICGHVYEWDMMELHHVLPWCRFKDLRGDRRNIMLLCSSCHKEIHLNPWKQIEMMKEKADELGINLEDIYGERAHA